MFEEGQKGKSWMCYLLYYKTYVRDQDYSNMIIVLRYNITTVIYELYRRPRNTTGPVAPVAQRYHVTSDTLEREFDPGKRDFSHRKTKK